ncbi:hypothetical protein [Parendozoicomonas haliclonae]|uniref:Heme oxygenase n=1 Tax=Parendozoicomonas haliclonae TaxID=1960125 RepID=A0A1X7AKL8_9GAMM|nr:hypothetical protein [Parendozoicomonas haliclonae]SMA47927.1 hypothetical protein EHSB41UT_02605 [Parendozoicomonas haliclonae]
MNTSRLGSSHSYDFMFLIPPSVTSSESEPGSDGGAGGATSLSENHDTPPFHPLPDSDRTDWTLSVANRPVHALPTFRKVLKDVEPMTSRIVNSLFIKRLEKRTLLPCEVMQFMMARKELFEIVEQAPLLERLGSNYGADQPRLWSCLPRGHAVSEDIQQLREITPDCQLEPMLRGGIDEYRRRFEKVKGCPVLIMAHYFCLYGAELVGGPKIERQLHEYEQLKNLQSLSLSWEKAGIDQPRALEHISLLVDRIVYEHDAKHGGSIFDSFSVEFQTVYNIYIGLFEWSTIPAP